MRLNYLPVTCVKAVFTAFLMISLMASCKDDDTPDTVDCAGLNPTYTNDIKAILDASCTSSGCHNSTDLANGFDFSNYTSAAAISQGNRFLGAINHQSGFSAMPQNAPKLSTANIELLTCWVEDGSPQ